MSVPTNAALTARAKDRTARDVVREWLDRHVCHAPGGFETRDEWLIWAADNFLADPEITQHLRPVTAPLPAEQRAEHIEADLIERVARAIHKSDSHAWSCGWPGCPHSAAFYRFAAAAIEVLRGER